MKKLIILAIVLQTVCSAGAQDSLRRTTLLVNGSFGIFMPLSSATFEPSGGVFAFQAQANFRNKNFLRLSFDQYNIGYKARFSAIDKEILIDDQVSLTFIGVDWGLLFPKGKWSPYFYVGAGAGLLDVPALSESPDPSQIHIVHGLKTAVALRAGIGIDYSINKMFILFGEAQGVLLPQQNVLQKNATYGVNFQIGIKTPLTN